jgi:lysophospholipase
MKVKPLFYGKNWRPGILRWPLCGVVIWALINAAGPAQALSEHELANGYAELLRDYMQREGERSAFSSDDGVVIRYQRFVRDCNQTAIVILPGWSEPFLKYAEVIYDLTSKHYCVYSMDFRGQGLSSRETTNPQLGHVQDFSLYVRDFDHFYQQVVGQQGHRQIFLLAHSMGGLVAALYGSQHAAHIDGVIMIAPMMGINTGAWPQWLAYRIASGLNWLGYGESFVFGHGPWKEIPFAENRLTHSAVRYQYGVDLFRQNEALVVGGVSNRWLKTSMEYGDKAIHLAPQFKHRILMFEAQHDSFTLSEPMRRFCSLALHCEKVYVPGAKHELLMETDAIRDRVFTKIYEFINE